MRFRASFVLAALIALGGGRSVFAQSADLSRVEISGGIRWIGPLDLGSMPANEITAGGGNRALFDSATTLDGSVGATATVGVRLWRRIRAEAALAYNATDLSVHITSDAEGAADATITSPVKQFLVEGGVLAEFPRSDRAALAPFVTGGVGYLRQLNDGRTLVETGHAYYLGGGLFYVRPSSRPRRVKATGFRADVRALVLRGGVASDFNPRPAAAVTATVFVRF